MIVGLLNRLSTASTKKEFDIKLQALRTNENINDKSVTFDSIQYQDKPIKSLNLNCDKAVINNRDFSDAIFPGSSWLEATINDVNLSNSFLRGSNFNKATLKKVNLSNTDCRDCQFDNTLFKEVTLDDDTLIDYSTLNVEQLLDLYRYATNNQIKKLADAVIKAVSEANSSMELDYSGLDLSTWPLSLIEAIFNRENFKIDASTNLPENLPLTLLKKIWSALPLKNYGLSDENFEEHVSEATDGIFINAATFYNEIVENSSNINGKKIFFTTLKDFTFKNILANELTLYKCFIIGGKFENCTGKEFNLECCNVSNTKFKKSTFITGTFAGTIFKNCEFEDIIFENNLDGVIFENCIFHPTS